MRKLTDGEQAVLDVIDEQIETLEAKLAKIQPKIDELARLRKARATMLDERSTTGTPRGSVQMEGVVHYLREEGASSVADIAAHLGTTPGSVRAHLNRYADERYRKDEDGDWELIGKEGEDEDGD